MTQRAALEALAEGRLPAGTSRSSLPRLRFDRVARRLVRDLQDVLGSAVPERAAVIVTVTAPIRLPARTVAAVNMRLRDHLAGGATAPKFDETICGNGVRARIVRSKFREAPKVIVFVCNPEPPPEDLLELAETVLAGRWPSTR